MMSLGTRASGSEINISKQQIVSYGRDLLTACRPQDGGGLWNVGPKWYVAIRGATSAAPSASGLWEGGNETWVGLEGVANHKA